LSRYGAGSGDREIAEHRVALAFLDDLDVPQTRALAQEAGGQMLRDLVAQLRLTRRMTRYR
jgi:hypothetical protein